MICLVIARAAKKERPGAGAVEKDRIRLQAKKLCSATLLLCSTQYFFAIYMIIYIRPVQRSNNGLDMN